jgi:hypothetical protein
MEEWFAYLSDQAVFIINAMALIVVFAGTVDAFVGAARFGFRLSARIRELRGVWVRYSPWLVAASPSSWPPSSSNRPWHRNGTTLGGLPRLLPYGRSGTIFWSATAPNCVSATSKRAGGGRHARTYGGAI